MKGEIENNNGFVEMSNPDGGFQSTASDILKFYREYHYGNVLLKEETKMKSEFYRMTREHMTTGGAIPMAGGFNGSNTVHYEILRDQISIIVFANMDEPVAEQLGIGILAIIRGEKPMNPSLPAIQNVYKAYNEHGIEYVKSNFDDLIVNFHPTDLKSIILNQIGYEFLFEDDLEEAIKVFQLNVDLFGKEDANVWDSLGEAYLLKGNKHKALEYYKKALQIDPNFPTALEAVQKLEE